MPRDEAPDLRDVRVEFAVGAFEPGAGDHTRRAVAGAGNEDHVEIVGTDQPVEMRVDEAEPRRGAEMPERPRLDVHRRDRLAQQRTVEQIDLADREIVGGTPPAVDAVEVVGRKWRDLGDARAPYAARGGRRFRHQAVAGGGGCVVSKAPARGARRTAMAVSPGTEKPQPLRTPRPGPPHRQSRQLHNRSGRPHRAGRSC